ncbi:MAG: AAA family ATPase [Candidatus Thiodiazotropha sp.]
MISEIEIENFRSIRSDKISLENITVLVGANGSGKSNLVKALDFLSAIPESGLDLAVSKQGGRDAITPKSIPIPKIKDSPTRFKYTVRLPTPHSKFVEGLQYVEADHEFELTFRTSRKTALTRESLTFHKVLYVGEVLSDENEALKISPESPLHFSNESTFTVKRDGKKTNYVIDPPLDESMLNSYVNWLGLDSFSEKITSPKELIDFLPNLGLRGSSSRKQKLTMRENESLIDPRARTSLDFSPNFFVFLQTIVSTKRYDLLLNELRRDQSPSDSSELTSAGANMPAVLRKIRSKSRQFQRLKSSLETIAPHIENLKSSSLRTGKEFVEFIEAKGGRGIESWESSDGSLRALAILVALETARNDTTIIIEEPEQNLHPWAIHTLIDHMREIVKERNIQLILTTHSEHVLDRVEPSEVRVVSRDSDTGTHFLRLNQIIPDGNIDMGDVGRMWVKGILGGVPSFS